MKSQSRILSAVLAGALVLGVAAPAKAIILTVTAVNNSTQSLTGGGSGDRAATNSLSVIDSGGSAPTS
jgi:hypothetical protein